MIKTTTATTKSKTKKVLKVYENIKYRSDPCCKMLQNLEKQKKKQVMKICQWHTLLPQSKTKQVLE